MPIYRYPRDDSAPAQPTQTSTTSSGPNAGLIAGLVTCSAVILFLSLVLVVPMLRRRRQRAAPPPSTVEEFLGKDSTFERSNPNDIAAILDHLSYLPQTDGAQTTPKRRSLLLGKRLSSQRPSSIIGPPPNSNRYSGQHRPVSNYRNSGRNWDSYYEKEEDQYDTQHSVPADMHDPPPLDEYANDHPRRDSFYVPASAPAAVSTSTRPLNVRRRSAYLQYPRRQARVTRDVTSPQSDYSESDSEDEYVHAYGSPNKFRPHTAAAGKENRGSTVGELIKSRFSRDSTTPRESFSLAAAPRSRRTRAPPMSKSSGMSSPVPLTARAPLEPLPEIPNSSIAVGFALPDSPSDVVVVTPTEQGQSSGPEQYRHVPLTPRNVALPRTPRTPGSPLKEVYTVSPPRTPLREVLTPRTPRPRRDVGSPI